MTDAQLAVARTHADEWCLGTLGYATSNLEFKTGLIEDLAAAGVAPASVDIVMSNCVVNLSPDKERVLQEVYRALKVGGEFHFSDVYVDRRLSISVRAHPILVGECLGGALYEQDFYRMCHRQGFLDVREVSRAPITVDDPALAALTGDAKFVSITYRLFKLHDLETLCEDYGQHATYLGGIVSHADAYRLDGAHVFPKDETLAVCGNTASMLGESWLRPFFAITGDRSVHRGMFAQCGTGATDGAATAAAGSCCGSEPSAGGF